MHVTPIPPEAMPVVRIIRRKVRRPATLPSFRNGQRGGPLRFGKKPNEAYCPMGALPNAIHITPCTPRQAGLPDGLNRAFNAFVGWWDSQTDPQAAVDAVWPTKKTRK
jgi:hypothetical protein